MGDIYERLAGHLDNLPAGFPRTESGVELRILKRLFTPDEAELATKLSLIPETAEQIAERLGEEAASLSERLESMARRGLIFRSAKGGQPTYMAAQFIIGIWEYHVQDLDEELIRDVNEYLPHVMRRAWFETRTKQMRVIPISESLEPESSIMPYEQAEEIIRRQSKIVLAPCICRREHSMLGQGCGRSEETCLVFGGPAHFYEDNRLGRPISVEEALEVLKVGLKEGLVLQPSNAQKPTALCLCCGCCCQILKNLKTLDRPAEAFHSNFYAEILPDSCTACGECREQCQMEAITVGEVAEVNLDRCIGCGLCVAACELEAVCLRQKEERLQYEPPESVVGTYMNMAKERGLL